MNRIARLFVYGTLGPGRPNEHVLEAIGGTWETASVTGKLHHKGWGAEMGYPAIQLHGDGEKVEGFLFKSEAIVHHWETLDAFEGEAYQRVLTEVSLEDGTVLEAHIYTLKTPGNG